MEYMGITTIQLNEETARWLKMYKEQHKLKTYDEVIRMFMGKRLGEYAKRFRGIINKKISHEELMKGLRDKNDRY